MPPLFYEKVPPTADDVHLSLDIVTEMNTDDYDDAAVLFTIGAEDAYRLSKDIERNPNGNVNLNEVRRGLSKAAEAVTAQGSKEFYLKGVESFIKLQLAPKSN